jgi:CheY-like chemotaxis protein
MALTGLSVLVVDDDHKIHEVLGDLLRFWGCTSVEVASNGEEAIECFRRTGPDLVLMDLEMPRMNGFDASSAIKSLNPQAEIILLTGVPNSRLARETLEQGFARIIIPKPFRSDQLKMAIQDAVKDRKPLSREEARRGAVA